MTVISKVCSFDDILPLFKDEQSIMFGGFGGIGTPSGLVDVLMKAGSRDLLLIGNDTGFPNIGIGKLVSNRRAKKLIVSHIGSNPNAGTFMSNGDLEIEFSPQGTLIERIRAGGVGLGGILCDIGLDEDIVKRDKQRVTVNGSEYLIEPALTADISIVYAEKADEFGNLIYDKSARNTNPLVAMAGKITVVEAKEIVPVGELDPEAIITSGVFVDYVVQSEGVNWKWVWEPR